MLGFIDGGNEMDKECPRCRLENISSEMTIEGTHWFCSRCTYTIPFPTRKPTEKELLKIIKDKNAYIQELEATNDDQREIIRVLNTEFQKLKDLD